MPRWLPNVWGNCCTETTVVSDDEGEPSGGEFDLNNLLIWSVGGAYQLITAIYDATGVIESGTILWPDGSTGIYSRTFKDAGCNMVNGYVLTHASSGATVTQPLITRDGFCNPINTPALEVSGYSPVPATAITVVVAFGEYDTAADVRLAIISAELISVGVDDFGTSGWFTREPTSTSADDGSNVLIDAAGIRFHRRHHV